MEDLGFQPTGEGQHRMVEIEKRDLNSDWVASQLAKLVGVKKRDVGLAGLKDRFAITRQWFSVDLAGREEPDWKLLESMPGEGQSLKILAISPHNRKIRKGALKGNHFVLRLRQVEGERKAIEERLEQIHQDGVPNYFGEQRFGRGGDNVERGLQMLRGQYRPRGRHERGLLLSALRSELFNQVCAARIDQKNWGMPLSGEVFALNRSRARFQVDEIDWEIESRLEQHDIHLTAPLWGRGKLESGEAVARLEQAVVSRFEEISQGLERMGLEQDRRAIRLIPDQLQWQWEEIDQLQLRFWLPAGSYATVVLRELLQ